LVQYFYYWHYFILFIGAILIISGAILLLEQKRNNGTNKETQVDLAEHVLSDTEDESDLIRIKHGITHVIIYIIGEFLTLDFALSLCNF